MTAIASRWQQTSMAPALTVGIAGGIAGGLAFGVMMQSMGMIPMVAMLVGSESVAVGWAVHLVNSVVIGGIFGLLAGRHLLAPAFAVAAGLVYGVAWWVVGALLLMPARLGMPVFQLDTTAWRSLMGHLVFGLILGGVSTVLMRRSRGAR